ncbi:hypothetical protein Dimus_036784, partial [Dionaea muscipula]
MPGLAYLVPPVVCLLCIAFGCGKGNEIIHVYRLLMEDVLHGCRKSSGLCLLGVLDEDDGAGLQVIGKAMKDGRRKLAYRCWWVK